MKDELEIFLISENHGDGIRVRFEEMMLFLLDKYKGAFSPSRFEELFLAEFNAKFIKSTVPFTEENKQATFDYIRKLAQYLINEGEGVRKGDPKTLLPLQKELRKKNGITQEYMDQIKAKYQ
jgi:hypothetical protein